MPLSRSMHTAKSPRGIRARSGSTSIRRTRPSAWISRLSLRRTTSRLRNRSCCSSAAARDGRAEDEGWLLRKDGSSFCANLVLIALRDDAGSFLGFTAVIRDLTERRLADEALQESEQRFRLLVQSIKDYGIFMLDPLGRIVSWNAGAERLKGYTADEIIGKHFSIFYPQEDLDARKPEWELEVASKVGRFEDEGWRLRKDGSRFWANVVITALRNESGELVGFAKVTRDLTERRAAQIQALADMRRLTEADMANRAKSEFLMAMSHELRTPLNAIGGYAELLSLGLGGGVTDRQREYLARIRKSQQHLMALINDILNFSRIEGGQITYEVTEISVGSVIDAVVPMIEPQAERSTSDHAANERRRHRLRRSREA